MISFLHFIIVFLQWAFMQDRAEQGGAAYVKQQVQFEAQP
jgi:hypothetical protein